MGTAPPPNFEALADLIEEVARSSDLAVRTARSPGSVSVSGPDSTPLLRARAALEELDALALETAEHHPYWHVLWACCQVLSAVLEGWDSGMTREDAEQARWSASQLAGSCSRL